MLGLVKFCLETTAKEDASGNQPLSSNIQPMDEDRRAWLQEAINSMSVDTTQLLLENLSTVKETIAQIEQDPTNQNIALQKTCDAIENLTNLCEDIDYACDFAKLDGFSIFNPLICCSHEELIVKACELIAALAQNNPLCQNMAMNIRLLERLIDFIDSKMSGYHTYIKARSYALYAISSIIRSNPEVRTHFETKLDGLSVLVQLLDYQHLDQLLDTSKESPTTSSTVATSSGDDCKRSSVYWWRKLRIRTIFLFRTLCLESETALKFFYEKEAIKRISEQLKNYQDPEIREHLLNALKAFLCSLDSSSRRVESLKLAPSLKEIIVQIEASIDSEAESTLGSDDYDMTEIRSTCKELLNLIDSVNQLKSS